MRIQISETLDTRDSDRVLRVLERCLREVSGALPDAVVRSDGEIILHGLGPSPTSVNRRDVTVLRVQAAEGKTVIEGDVSFQASALLGGTSASQQEVVSSKLERIFEKVKMELRREEEKPPPPAAKPTAAEARRPGSEVRRAGERPVAAAAAGDGSERPIAGAAGAERLGEMLAKEAEAEPALGASTAAVPEERLRWGEQDAAAPMPFLRTLGNYKEEEDEDSPSRAGRWVALAILLVALAAGGFYMWGRGRFRSFLTPRAPAAVSTEAPKTVAPPAPAVEEKASTEDQGRANVAGSGEDLSDPKAWLEAWAAAMRSRDADLQSRFYADPVEHYLGRGEVSRETVRKDRQATIDIRQGLWTMRIERVVVERQTPDEVQVRLVKHFIDQPDSGEILESDAPTRLVLKRVGPGWRISSEQELSRSFLEGEPGNAMGAVSGAR